MKILRILGLACLAGCLLGAADNPREARAWKAVENAQGAGDAERTLSKALDYLEDFADEDHAADVRLLAGRAAFELERWPLARRQLEGYLKAGGREDVDGIQHRVAICLSREGNKAAAVPALRNTARRDADPDRGAAAARELIGMHLFDGEWKQAVEAQELLLERDRFVVPGDLDTAREAIKGMGEGALEIMEERLRGTPVGGVLALLLLDDNDQLLETAETEPARRQFARRYHDHPLLEQVPGAEEWAAAPEDTDPTKIGILLPTTGKYGHPGTLALRGVEQALALAEEMGLTDLQIVVQDTGDDAEQATAALDRLVKEDKVIAVIGPIVSAQGEVLNDAAEDLGVPLLMMVQRPGLAADREHVFNTWVTAEEQVDALVEQAVARLGIQNFAIAYPGKAGGARLADRFWTQVEAAGARVTAVESYDPGSTDFRETGRRLKGSHYKSYPPGEVDITLAFLPERRKPQISDPQTELTPGIDFQAIFVPDNYKRVTMLAPGFLFEEINLGNHLPAEDFPPVTLMGGSALNHPDLVARGGKYVNGTMLVDGLFLESPDPVVQRFLQGYRSTHNADPTLLEATAFDATRFVMQLLAEGVVTRREFVERLHLAAPAESVTGALGFSSGGEMRHEMRVLQVDRKEEAIVQIWPPVRLPEEEGASEKEAASPEEAASREDARSPEEAPAP